MYRSRILLVMSNFICMAWQQFRTYVIQNFSALATAIQALELDKTIPRRLLDAMSNNLRPVDVLEKLALYVPPPPFFTRLGPCSEIAS
jgi:hypothetical protein